MTPMLEAVARAAYEKYFENLIGDLEPHWDELPESHRLRLIEAQRAAIEAVLARLPPAGRWNRMDSDESSYAEGWDGFRAELRRALGEG